MVFTHHTNNKESFDCAICGKRVDIKVTGYDAQMVRYSLAADICRVSQYTRNIHLDI
jgi:transcription elongation factor Elf1